MGDGTAGHSTGVSPLSTGGLSGAFSESDYHDAVEELSERGSSLDGHSFSLGSPGASSAGRHSHGRAGEEHHHDPQQQHGLVDRIALWWEGRRATNHTTGEEEGSGTPGDSGVGPFTPRSPISPVLSVSEGLCRQSCGCAACCAAMLLNAAQALLQSAAECYCSGAAARALPGVLHGCHKLRLQCPRSCCPSTDPDLCRCPPLPPPMQGVPADEVIEPSPESLKSGCIHLFGSGAHGLAHKKYVRLSKPPAGSSFRVRCWASCARVGRIGACCLLRVWCVVACRRWCGSFMCVRMCQHTLLPPLLPACLGHFRARHHLLQLPQLALSSCRCQSCRRSRQRSSREERWWRQVLHQAPRRLRHLPPRTRLLPSCRHACRRASLLSLSSSAS